MPQRVAMKVPSLDRERGREHERRFYDIAETGGKKYLRIYQCGFTSPRVSS